MRKERDYHEMREVLQKEDGCVVCHLLHGKALHYLESIFYEYINDVGFRTSLMKSGGFCHQHAWLAHEQGDPLGHAILYKSLLEAALSNDLEKSGKKMQSAGKCIVCEHLLGQERACLEILIKSLGEDEFEDLLEQKGLCMPHYRRALELCGERAEAESLKEAQKRFLDGLIAQLFEFIRKHDYRFGHEPYGEEKRSWIRAIETIVGLRL